jgi:hypothetical protein
MIAEARGAGRASGKIWSKYRLSGMDSSFLLL